MSDEPERDEWESDVDGDIIEDEDGERKFVLVDREKGGRIESDTSVRLDKVE